VSSWWNYERFALVSATGSVGWAIRRRTHGSPSVLCRIALNLAQHAAVVTAVADLDLAVRPSSFAAAGTPSTLP